MGTYCLYVKDSLLLTGGYRPAFYKISDLNNPESLYVGDSIGYVYDALINGNYAYFTGRDSGLVVYDISDFTNIHKIASYKPSSISYFTRLAGRNVQGYQWKNRI